MQDWEEDGARSRGKRKEKEMAIQGVWVAATREKERKKKIEEKGGEEEGGMNMVR